jgi:3-hydroxyisobutyrate dehydrogenase-like beta-hydroxyacid dehydrogenase
MKLTFLGLGEAGSLLAKDLAERGAEVVAFDSAKPKNPVVPLVESLDDAVANANVVFSLNSANVAIKMAQQAAPHLKQGAIYCDLNRGTPDLKKRLAAIIDPGSFVDIALIEKPAGVAGGDSLTISGGGALKFIEFFDGLGLNINFVSEIAGDAAARGLIRSMLSNGVAAIVIDTLWAAGELGLKDWAIEEMHREFDSNSSQTIKHYLDQTQQNPKRQSVEMADIVETLTEAGYESTTIRGVELTLSRVIHGVRVPFADLA